MSLPSPGSRAKLSAQELSKYGQNRLEVFMSLPSPGLRAKLSAQELSK